MAQATSYKSPDMVDAENTVTNTDASATGEKKSVFGKIKDRTKTKTKKLKNKLKPGSGGEGGAAVGEQQDDTSSSSSDEEENAPVNNAFSGVTQPEYERQLDAGKVPQREDPETLSGHAGSPIGDISSEDFNKRGPNDFPQTGQQIDIGLSKQFESLSTSDKNDQSSDRSGGEKLGPISGTGGSGRKDPILSRVGQPQADDTTAGPRSDPENLLSGEKSEPTKTWGQWVGEKVGLGGKSPSTTESPTPDNKPITDKAYESVLGAKDAVVGKSSEAAQSAKNQVEGTKEAANTTDPSKQTYTQKLTGAIYGAKDSLVSSTQPGDHDKALSQKVTESVSNLPTTIKSSLGMGGVKSPGASSPTTTPAIGTDAYETSGASPTEEAAGAPPQSPGLVSRITGSVTSLFGGKKSPTDSTSPVETETTPSSGLGTSETSTADPSKGTGSL